MITLPPFKAFLASNIPSVYDNTLSYYDELTKLIAYLEQQVVPAINETAGQVDGIKKGLEDLKSYVDHYFDNLDVQEEINNKLDEMAEGGQLAGIIAQFLAAAPVFAYGSVSELAGATNLVNGCLAETFGFYAAGDGGGSKYIIRTKTGADTPDGVILIALTNLSTLIAEKVEESKINVKQYGAYGDGVHDDYTAIQYAYTKNPAKTIFFPAGTYLVSATIKTNSADDANDTLLDDAAVIKASQALNEVFEIGGINPTVSPAVYHRRNSFVGGEIDASGCQTAIKINGYMMGTEIKDTTISNFTTYGIYAVSSAYSSDMKIQNCYINGIQDNTYTSYGVMFERPDNEITHCRINGITEAVKITAGGLTMIDVHGLGIGGFANSVFLDIAADQAALIVVDSCYCDNFQTFVKTRGNYNTLTITNSSYMTYESPVDVKLFDLDGRTNILIEGNTFNIPVKSTYCHGVVFYNIAGYSLYNSNFTIKNNKILNSHNLDAGDLLLTTDNYYPFWNNDNNTMPTSNKQLIGYMVANNAPKSLTINVDGITWNYNFRIERYNGTTYLTKNPSTKSDDNVSLELGFKYLNNNKGYDVYALYVSQPAGTALKQEMFIVNNNESEPFMAIKQYPADPDHQAIVMDDTFTV